VVTIFETQCILSTLQNYIEKVPLYFCLYFAKCRSVFKILSLTDLAVNF